MNSGITKDGKRFVEDIVGYLTCDGKKQTLLPKVQTLLGKVSSQAKKEKLAKITSVVSLTAREKQELTDALTTIIGHELTLEYTLDKTLVAGLYIQIADFIIDTSYRTKLSDMTALLMR